MSASASRQSPASLRRGPVIGDQRQDVVEKLGVVGANLDPRETRVGAGLSDLDLLDAEGCRRST